MIKAISSKSMHREVICLSSDGKRYKWMLAGSMLGMMSVYAGQSMMHSARGNNQKARKVTAKASRMTRDAGDFISALGETMLDRIK